MASEILSKKNKPFSDEEYQKSSRWQLHMCISRQKAHHFWDQFIKIRHRKKNRRTLKQRSRYLRHRKPLIFIGLLYQWTKAPTWTTRRDLPCSFVQSHGVDCGWGTARRTFMWIHQEGIAKCGRSIAESTWTSDRWITNMAERKSGVSSLITSGVKNTMIHDLIMHHCLMQQEIMCAKSVRMTNAVTAGLKLIVISQKTWIIASFKAFEWYVASILRWTVICGSSWVESWLDAYAHDV
jgi:hypothetical protein